MEITEWEGRSRAPVRMQTLSGLHLGAAQEVVRSSQRSRCISKQRQYPLNQNRKSSEYLWQAAKLATNSSPCVHATAVHSELHPQEMESAPWKFSWLLTNFSQRDNCKHKCKERTEKCLAVMLVLSYCSTEPHNPPRKELQANQLDAETHTPRTPL